jgi:hypothetical protein
MHEPDAHVAVIVTVPLLLPPVIVTVTVGWPPGESDTLDALRETVWPPGETERLTVPAKPPRLVTVSVSVSVYPWVIP